MKYRKKPVVIEAYQHSNSFWTERARWPEWLGSAVDDRGVQVGCGHDLRIFTLEGVMIATPGDWIIQGVKGELYPCKPDIFQATYEPAQPLPESEVER